MPTLYGRATGAAPPGSPLTDEEAYKLLDSCIDACANDALLARVDFDEPPGCPLCGAPLAREIDACVSGHSGKLIAALAPVGAS